MAAPYTIEFSIAIDFQKMADARDWLDPEARHRWLKAAEESAAEFAEDMEKFLTAHPFIKSFTTKTTPCHPAPHTTSSPP